LRSFKKSKKTFRPQYEQLAEKLAAAIRNGRFKRGQQIPTELELMKSSGLSRITVRQAVSRVVKLGLIVRRRGLGTFVAPARISQEWSTLSGFYDLLAAQGIYPDSALLDFRRTIVSPALAERLGAKSVTLSIKSYSVENVVIGIFYTYLPNANDITREMIASQRSYDLLRQLGRNIARASVSVRAGNANQTVCRALSIKAVDPILIVERMSYGRSGDAVELTVGYVRSDMYELTFNVNGSLSLTNALNAMTAGSSS
jgi:GntR family transcriptional regulator